ncbi:MAG TPA: RsmD family RNA methyltransferase, partial [Myxococcota bacterium]|nr:RsmD family RNA methyltransferase [Myxococcota bacterium]
VISPSPDWRAPPCPHDADCGGCDLSALTPHARRAALASMVQRALGLDAPPEVIHAPEQGRARIKLTIDGERLGYRGARSHSLVPVDRCGVARPELSDALPALRRVLAERPGLADAVELRTDGERVVYAFLGGRWEAADRAATAALGRVAHDGRAVHGDVHLWLPVQGLRLRAGPRAFFQVDLALNGALVGFVRDAVAAARPERALDLYAGIGNLGLPIAATGVPVLAVEQEASALSDLAASAEAAGLGGVRTLAIDAARFDPSREVFDVAVLDPPRAGAGEVLSRALRNRPRRVVVVSCDVRSAARDLRIAKDQRYRLVEVRCFDLFPDTHHVETVTVFERA